MIAWYLDRAPQILTLDVGATLGRLFKLVTGSHSDNSPSDSDFEYCASKSLPDSLPDSPPDPGVQSGRSAQDLAPFRPPIRLRAKKKRFHAFNEIS